jgi:hypothetical protein
LGPANAPSRSISVKMIAAASRMPAREIECRHCRRLGPAFDRDFAITRIDPDRDFPGEFATALCDKAGIGQRGGPQDDARDTFAEPGLDGRKIADAAAELRRDAHRFEDRLDARRVHRLAGKGPVEIDEVEPATAGLGEASRLRGGIFVEDGCGAHLAAQQPDAAAVLQIDGRIKDHGRPLARPASRLK